jgi:predicted dehydrogenase
MATFAVVTDGVDRAVVPVLRAAGADVVGLLGPDPFDSMAWAAADDVARCYPELGDLLQDSTDAVCVADGGPSAVHVTRAALRAGRHVLLSHPVAVDRDLLEVADEAMLLTAVALRTRAWPGAAAVAAHVPDLAEIRQVTVLGWPRGDRLELVDVLRRWCGDVVAVCASPDAMPARDLAGSPVTLALLMTNGATVLVAEHDASTADPTRAVITLIGTAGRLLMSEGQLLRQAIGGGAPLPEPPLPAGRHPLEVAAAALLRVLRDEQGEFAAPRERTGGAGGTVGMVGTEDTAVASLRDVLIAEQVIVAAEASQAAGGWEEL